MNATVESPIHVNRRFFAGFVVGVPWTFWADGRPYLDRGQVRQPGFHWGSLLGDLALALSTGVGFGIGFQRRNKANPPPSAENSPPK
jgi:hypothetical protein